MKRRIIGGMTLLAIGIVVVQFLPTRHASIATPAQPAPARAKPATSQTSDAYPVMAAPHMLRIPSLSIASTIRPVGTTTDGAMDIPDSLTDTGWYSQSAQPGNPGKAVLAVHTGYPNKPSQFRRLEHIQPGTAIEVQDITGATAHFAVIQTARYTPDTAPLGSIFGASPTARLNIITCTGQWDPASASYKERLVIFAARTE